MLRHPIGHYVKMLHNTQYRERQLEIRKLWKTERYTPMQTRLINPPVQVADSATFLPMYHAIFESEVYKFVADTETPYILDGGANIGLSALYFKRLYPEARIVAFEPDPKIYTILDQNIRDAGLQNVQLVNRALWNEETSLWFASEGSDAGRLANDGADTKDFEVKTVRLRDYLDRPIDFLKLDIEGAETTVMEDCRDHLGQVKRIFVEYHSFAGRPQTLDTVLTVLKDSGFRVHIHTENPSDHPFVAHNLLMGMDMQLDIFAYRA